MTSGAPLPRRLTVMDDAEFLAQATGIVNELEDGLRRVSLAELGGRRALEIGCGSGRLMRPLSRHFLEIHGVDPSPVRAAQAKENLADIPNARVHTAEGGGLPALDGETFDFIYSLEAGFNAWPWLDRSLRDGGLARLRFHGLETTRTDVLEFAAAHDLQVLALDAVATRSMWTTWRKRASGWSLSLAAPPANIFIRRITNAYSSEPVAPCRGRFASIAIRAENLPPDAGLQHLRVTVGSSFGTVTSIGELDRTGSRLVHADLPELEATGLLPVQLLWLEQPLCEPASLRVIPPGPAVPRLTGMHKRPGGNVTITVEEIARPDELIVTVDGHAATGLEYICTDPRSQCYEVSFHLPEEAGAGRHHAEVSIGGRKLWPLPNAQPVN